MGEIVDKTLKIMSLYDVSSDQDYVLILKALSDVEYKVHYVIRLNNPGASRLLFSTDSKKVAVEKFHFYHGYYTALADSRLNF